MPKSSSRHLVASMVASKTQRAKWACPDWDPAVNRQPGNRREPRRPLCSKHTKEDFSSAKKKYR
eukprot:7977090-Pyramimonas_sp.AAC.1